MLVCQRRLYSCAVANFDLTHLNGSLEVLVLVLQDEHRALPKVLYQILEYLELAKIGALMNERVATIVRAKNQLMNLDMVEPAEYIYKSIDVAALDGGKQHVFLDLPLGIIPLHLLELRLLLSVL